MAKSHGAKWVDGKFGKALEFDGASSWVEVPHSNTVGFKAGVSFTITLHFKGTKVAGALVGKNYEDTSQVVPWYLLWNGGADNKVTLYLRGQRFNQFPSRWHHRKLATTNGILSSAEPTQVRVKLQYG